MNAQTHAPLRWQAWWGEPTALAAILAVGLALRFWRLGALPLVGDESYFWLWSRFPAWSYFDHPGGTAWLIWLSTHLGGNSEFGIRWLNALLASGHVVLVYGLGRQLFTPAAGLLSAGFLAAAAPFVLVGRFVYTDSLTFFLFLSNLYLLAPLITPHDDPPRALPTWRWALVAASGFLLLNTKLSVYGYVLSWGLGILLWRRDLLRDARLWLAVGGALLGVLPFVLWNMAHAWVGMAWIFQQATQETIPAANKLAAVYHMLGYFSPPVALLCLVGLARWRGRPARWLLLLAAPLLLPVLVSPANSPRNLLLGALLLILLAGAWFADAVAARRLRWGWPALMLATTALYGLGTSVALVEETRLPQSSVAKAVRLDAVGWPSLARELAGREGLILTVDYSAASQLWYYAARPVYSHWGQYLVWGIPDQDEATIVSQEYVPPARVSAALAASYMHVEGPVLFEAQERGLSKRVYLWRVRGRQVTQAAFLARIDFFRLYWAERSRE